MALTNEQKLQRAREHYAGVIATLPEEKRAQAQAGVDVILAEQAAALKSSDGVLKQDEFNRSMDEGRAALAVEQEKVTTQLADLTAERKANRDWYDANKPALDEYVAWKKRGGPDPDPDPDPDPNNPRPAPTGDFVTKADLATGLEEFGARALPVIETYAGLGSEHQDAFGTRLSTADLQRVREHAHKASLTLVDAYHDLYKAEYAEKAKAEEDEKLKKARDEGKAEAIAEMRSGPPYAIPGQAPSVLDALEAPTEQKKAIQDAADTAAMAHEYRQKTAEADPDSANWVG